MREPEYLRQRYAAILSAVGVILMITAMVILSPLAMLVVYSEELRNAAAFIVPAGCMGAIGLLLHRGFRSYTRVTLSVREGGVIVLVSWILVMLFSAWPFASVLGISFSKALFESVSGWTTTGLSVVDVTTAGHMILFFRSALQLAGGAGLAIIMMSAIVGPTGTGISSAEGRGDQLVPQVRESARLVLMIYAAYALVGTMAYCLAGMSFFDAINHAFCAVSTGGFSTRPESIGYWDSPLVEAVTLPMMLLGNLSFVTAWFLWRGRIRNVLRNGEVRLLGLLFPLAAGVLFLFTTWSLYPQIDKSIRVAIFQTVSAITTTGYSTAGFGNWNAIGVFLLIILMLIGGGTCSTAGGIKQFRIYLLGKLLYWEFKRSLMPRAAIVDFPIWEGGRRVFVNDARLRQLTVFVFIYLATYFIGVMMLCGCGFSLADALFEFASALGTVGLSVGATSPHMPEIALWIEIIAMFLGRLEFMVVIISLLKISRDGRLLWMRTSKES